MIQFTFRGHTVEKSKLTEWIGYIGGILTTGSYIPGAISVWKLYPAPATAIDFSMYIALNVGAFLWFMYGIRTKKWPITISNAVILPFSISILIYKYLYG